MRRVEHLVNATFCLSLLAGAFSEAAQPRWWANSPIPIENGLNQTTAVVADNGLIYLIGGGLGYRPDSRTDGLLAYDPRSDSYWDLTPIPIADGISAYGAAAAIGTNIYVFGGVAGVLAPVYLQTLWIYDIVNDAWSPGADMPAQRWGSAVGVVNGKIIIAGGGTTTIQNSTWIYDPGSDGYTTVASMPEGLNTYRIHGVGFSNRGEAGQFHAFAGGFNGTGHFVYDVAANRWSLAPAMPLGVTDPGVATFGSNVYLTGGTSGSTGRLQIYNLDTNTWSVGAIMLSPVNNTSVVVTSEGVLYNFGGANQTDAIPTNQSMVAP